MTLWTTVKSNTRCVVGRFMRTVSQGVVQMARAVPRLAAAWVSCIVMMSLAFVLVAAMPSAAWAEDEGSSDAMTSEQSSNSSQLNVNGSITDTQNLLGDNVTAVTDAITSTKNDTGVSVRLLYVDTFGDNADPDQWAKNLLNATNPPSNTVLLAVASNDGKLVVAVSENSDGWLRDSASKLSEAALGPIVNGSTPDWSGSAIAMMNQIATQQKTSTSSGSVVIGVAVLGGVLVALVVGAVIVVVVRRRRSANGDKKPARRRHKRH
ncbi:TPM domain-containing protein [Bifidobacterium tsurumiense]|uniref:TPM domain-containing protein n=1 Tax=Bifidobacterium tsurumiense TaxID=356829 RepID=UPI0018A6D12B|nr:TPM domain-containing protein [Bifidobacterium tsurumiense]